jgi:hypothetical protein
MAWWQMVGQKIGCGSQMRWIDFLRSTEASHAVVPVLRLTFQRERVLGSSFRLPDEVRSMLVSTSRRYEIERWQGYDQTNSGDWRSGFRRLQSYE